MGKYVQSNTEVRPRNHLLQWKAIIITYSECVFVALCIQHAMRMRHIVICGLSDSTTFLHIISQTTLFSGGGGREILKMCFDILHNFCLNSFSF